MSRDEWLKRVLADRPALSQAQVARLRPILAPIAPHMRTPPDEDEGRTQTPAQTKGINRHDPRTA